MQLHADEISVTGEMVETLVATLLPNLAGLPIRPVRPGGTDHYLFRVGTRLVLRLPRRPEAEAQIGREARWLPHIAPHLPLRVPEPVALLAPSALFDHGFGLYRWIDGDSAAARGWVDEDAAAAALAGFVAALRAVDGGHPPPGAPPAGRGGPLAPRDAAVRQALAALAGTVDAAACRAVWDECLAAAPHDGPEVWLHGDLIAGNLLVAAGVLAAVIDFGGIGIGDPAADLIPAWASFGPQGRARYRAALDVPEAQWRRGRGWALSFALIALPYYRDSHPVLAGIARRTLAAICDEWHACR